MVCFLREPQQSKRFDPRRLSLSDAAAHTTHPARGRRGSERFGVPIMPRAKYCLGKYQHHLYDSGRCIRCGRYQQGTSDRIIYDFWRQTFPGPNGCILWTGRLTKDGHGRCDVRVAPGEALNQLAHRVAWRIAYGKYPAKTLDHLCRVRNCLNVAHLEDVSLGENVGRGLFRAVCKRGHLQIPHNRYVNPKTGRSRCKLCLRISPKTKVHR